MRFTSLVSYEIVRGTKVEHVTSWRDITARVEPAPMSGTCIVHPDDRECYKRGAAFTFYDGVRTVTGTVVRRRAQRDGSVKLWLEVGEIVAGES